MPAESKLCPAPGCGLRAMAAATHCRCGYKFMPPKVRASANRHFQNRPARKGTTA